MANVSKVVNPLLCRNYVFLMMYFWIKATPRYYGARKKGKIPEYMKDLYDYLGWDDSNYDMDLAMNKLYETRRVFYRNRDELKKDIVSKCSLNKNIVKCFIDFTYKYYKESFNRYQEGNALESYLDLLDLNNFEKQVKEIINGQKEDINLFLSPNNADYV